MTRQRHDLRVLVVAAVAVVLLAAGSTVALAAAGRVFGEGGRPAGVRTICTAPSLPGTRVDVLLFDMGEGMMGHAGSMHGRTGMSMAVLEASPQVVAAGPVSFRARNLGVSTHELVVLPLPAGVSTGERTLLTDDTVDESGRLAEASASCREGEGDGIRPGTSGWVTVDLRPGRYELACNRPGHYAAGMFTELIVT